MEPEHSSFTCLPPAPKTVRGEPAFIDVSPKHLLYFNESLLVLRCLHDDSILTLTHPADVVAAKFSPNFRYVASIDEKGNLFINEVLENKLYPSKNFEGVYRGAKAIDWTSDEKRICIVGNAKGNFGRIISVDTGTDVGNISAVMASLNSASFRPERPFKLVTGGDQHSIKVFEGPPYKFVRSNNSHKNFINQIKYNKEGKYFASVSSDKKLVLYDGLSCEVVKQVSDAHEGSIYGLTWIDNETMVTVSSDKRVKYWNIELENIKSIQICQKQEMKNIDYFIVGICEMEKRVYCLCLNGQIKELEDGKTVKCYDGWKSKPFKIINETQNTVLIFDLSGKAFRYHIKNKSLERILKNKKFDLILDAAYHPDKKLLLILSGNNVFIYDLPTENLTSSVEVANSKFICSSSAAFFTFGNQISKYDYEGNKINTLPYEDQITTAKVEQNLIFVGTIKGTITVFDTQTLKSHHSFTNTPNPTKITSFCLCNEKLFVGDSNGTIKVWKCNPNEQVSSISTTMGGHDSTVTEIIRKQDQIYSFGMDNKYKIWNIENLSRKETNEIHKGGIINGKLSDKWMITSGGNFIVRVDPL